MSEPHRLRMRELVDGPRATLLPGAVDALTARTIEQFGFDAVYLSGAGFANAQLGVPDIGLVSLTEIALQTERLREAVDIPIVVDGDTGFGGPLNVMRTVRLLERRGASAIQLEDQEFPKRCGHFDGKSVVAPAEMVARISAAVDARDDENFVVIARTDARATEGLSAAIDRAHLYRETGADVLFVEAPQSRDEIEAVATSLPGPLLINVVEGGKTPMLGVEELEALGYALVLYANSAMRAAIHGVQHVLSSLLEKGSTADVLDSMLSWEDRQALVGKPAFDLLEKRYDAIAEGSR
jgi:2-methylisocitrate lyase-like PEP mutase family enzyme